jgi:hypothetical protein
MIKKFLLIFCFIFIISEAFLLIETKSVNAYHGAEGEYCEWVCDFENPEEHCGDFQCCFIECRVYNSFYPDFYPEFYADFYPEFYADFYPDFYPAFNPGGGGGGYASFSPASYSSFSPNSYSSFSPSGGYNSFNPYGGFYPSFYPAFNPYPSFSPYPSFIPALVANLSGTTKSIYSVNGIAYNPTIPIKSGDIVVFEIMIRNTGPSSATINYICDTSSSNFINFANLNVGSFAAVGAECAGATTRINFAGGLVVPGTPATNRSITFQTTFSSTGAGSIELCYNRARILYNDGEASNKAINKSFGPVLCNQLQSNIPKFLEIAP